MGGAGCSLNQECLGSLHSSLAVLWLTEGGIQGDGLHQNVRWKKTKLALGKMLNCQSLK